MYKIKRPIANKYYIPLSDNIEKQLDDEYYAAYHRKHKNKIKGV